MTPAPAVWVPLAAYQLFTPDMERGREFLSNVDSCCVELAGRLRRGASRAAATAELQLAASRFSRGDDASRLRVTGTSVAAQPWDPGTAAAFTLVVARVLVVLLIACANIGNLQLARAMSRRHELTVRAVLGAGRARIVRQLLTEGLLIAAIASATAAAAAYLIVRTFHQLVFSADGVDPRWVDLYASLIAPDLRVVCFGYLLATAAILIAGIGPALAGTRRLRSTGPASSDRPVRMRTVFLAVQVAFSVVLLVGAALLTRGVTRATALIPDTLPDVVRLQVRVPDPGGSSTTMSASRVDRGMPWTFDASEPTSMYGISAAVSASNTVTTASSAVTCDPGRRGAGVWRQAGPARPARPAPGAGAGCRRA